MPRGADSGGPGPAPFVRSRKRFKVYTWKYKRTLGPAASVVLLLNQIFGFGMNVIPAAVGQHGALPVLLCNLLVCVLASLCSLMMLEAMTLIPHNANFEQRIEYNSLVKYYLSNFAFRAISLLHYVGDFCAIVFGIAIFARLIDSGVSRVAGSAPLLQVLPPRLLRAQPAVIYGGAPAAAGRAPYAGPVGPVISIGYLLCVAICLLVNANTLEGIKGLNYVSLAVLLGCIAQMALAGRAAGPHAPVGRPALGARNFLELLFLFVDNYSLCNIMPSWANEMKAAVRPGPTLWGSALGAAGVYALLGLLRGAYGDVFAALEPHAAVWGALPVALFIVFTAVPDVVFGCISLRYNLLNLGYCDGDRAYLWGCVAPFAFSWLFLRDGAPQRALGAVGLTASLVCNFLVPIIIYLVANGQSAPHLAQGAKVGHTGRTARLAKRISKIIHMGQTRLSSGLAVPALVRHLFASGEQGPTPAERESAQWAQGAPPGHDVAIGPPQGGGGNIAPPVGGPVPNGPPATLNYCDAVGVAVEEISSLPSKGSLRAGSSLVLCEKFLKSITLGLTPTGSINSLFKSMTVSLAGSRMGSRLASRMGSFFRGPSGAQCAQGTGGISRGSTGSRGGQSLAPSAQSTKEFPRKEEENSAHSAENSIENSPQSEQNGKNFSALPAEKAPGGPAPDYASFRIVRNSKVLTTDELFNAFNRPSKVYTGGPAPQEEFSPEAKKHSKRPGAAGPRVRVFPAWAGRHQLLLARLMCLAIGALAVAQPLLYLLDVV